MGRSDAELLEASRRGERDAFGALIERYQGVVCAVSYTLDITGTPTFVINGKRIVGNLPVENLRGVIDQALAAP